MCRYAAALACYGDETGEVEAWRRRLLVYLRANRDHTERTLLAAELPLEDPGRLLRRLEEDGQSAGVHGVFDLLDAEE